MISKLSSNLVRRVVLLGIDICRLVFWMYALVNLITNYKAASYNGKLRKSLPATQR